MLSKQARPNHSLTTQSLNSSQQSYKQEAACYGIWRPTTINIKSWNSEVYSELVHSITESLQPPKANKS